MLTAIGAKTTKPANCLTSLMVLKCGPINADCTEYKFHSPDDCISYLTGEN
jgi:hypothetical protein